MAVKIADIVDDRDPDNPVPISVHKYVSGATTVLYASTKADSVPWITFTDRPARRTGSGVNTALLNDHGENRGTVDLLARNGIVEVLGLVPSRDNNSPLHLVRILA